MNRKRDICEKCEHFNCLCNYYDPCSPFYECKIEKSHVFSDGRRDRNLVVLEDWNEQDVPKDCTFYADYFVEECNEEKI